MSLKQNDEYNEHQEEIKEDREVKKARKSKCKAHFFFQDWGGEITKVDFEKGELVTTAIKGRGTYCMNCGYKPKSKETPQIFKDFKKMVRK